MKTEQLKTAYSNISPIVCLLHLFILLIISLFIGAADGFAKEISGYVRTSSGSGIEGVNVTFDNVRSTTTNESGYYSIGIPNSWSGTSIPTKDGFNFNPASLSYVNVTSNLSNQDYIGTQVHQANTISGYVRTSSGGGINEVTLTFSNGGGTDTTNSSGYCSHEIAYGWSGTVTPTKEDYIFDPASRSYSNVTTNQSNQDYTGTQAQPDRTISGYVRTSSGNGFSGVTVTFGNGGGTDTTNSSGYYSRNVTSGWSGTVTPTREGYRFTPVSRSYSDVTNNQSNQNYTINTVNKLLSITINIVGSGNVEIEPEKNYYSKGSLITMTATANSGWLFSEWSGGLDSPDNPERIFINSDMTITAVFLADYDNDGVSNKEENAGPIDGDGNNDGILDSLQSNVSSLAIDNATDYVVLETPPGTSIKNCKAVIEPPDNNYPSGVDFSYGFFSFTVAGIRIGGSTSVTFYFPSEITFNTYSKYGPTPDDPFDHWYEFIFDGQTGAKLNKNNITLHFIDGKRGDDDLTENGIIVDIGGPGVKAILPSEFNSQSDGGGGDGYGCFVGCLL